MAANAGLAVIARHRCPNLLNDNTAVLGPWNHVVDWICPGLDAPRHCRRPHALRPRRQPRVVRCPFGPGHGQRHRRQLPDAHFRQCARGVGLAARGPVAAAGYGAAGYGATGPQGVAEKLVSTTWGTGSGMPMWLHGPKLLNPGVSPVQVK